MHMHACNPDRMRTTVEIGDEQRAKLLELAAKRGKKGFSDLVREALDHYLAATESRQELIEDALGVIGTLGDAAAQRLENSMRALRGTWR